MAASERPVHCPQTDTAALVLAAVASVAVAALEEAAVVADHTSAGNCTGSSDQLDTGSAQSSADSDTPEDSGFPEDRRLAVVIAVDKHIAPLADSAADTGHTNSSDCTESVDPYTDSVVDTGLPVVHTDSTLCYSGRQGSFADQRHTGSDKGFVQRSVYSTGS